MEIAPWSHAQVNRQPETTQSATLRCFLVVVVVCFCLSGSAAVSAVQQNHINPDESNCPVALGLV